MQVTQLYSGQNRITGDFIYRIEMPAEGLSGIDGVEVYSYDLLRLKNFRYLLETPLLILHHISDPDLLPVVSERKKRGLPTIYELADNYRASYLHQPDALKIGPPDYHHIMELLLRRCDAVQTTSVALKARFAKLNEQFFVFPNLVESIAGEKKIHSDTLIIGWAGSTRHYDDLKFYATEIAAWIKANPDTKLALMATQKIVDLFADVPKSQLILKKPGSLSNYLDFLSMLDIGLAPLLPNEFNACRSDVKFLEYASRGVLPLCSRFGPYLELWKHYQDLQLFETPMHLIEKLDELRADIQKREQLTQSALAYVRESRCFQTYNWRGRIAKYATLFKNPKLWLETKSSAGSSLCSAMTYNLLTKATGNQSENKIIDFKKAISMEPENYQAQAFYGAALIEKGHFKDAETFLKNALKLNPASLRSTRLLAQAYLFGGKLSHSLKWLKAGLKFEPAMPLLQYIFAVVLMARKKNQQAFSILQKVVAKFPDYVEAQILYCRLALKEKYFDDAQEAVKILKRLTPKSAEVALLQAEIAIAGEDFFEAINWVSQALDLDPYHKYAKKLLDKVNVAVQAGLPQQAPTS